MIKPVKLVNAKICDKGYYMQIHVANRKIRDIVNTYSKAVFIEDTFHSKDGLIIPKGELKGSININKCYDPKEVKLFLESLGKMTLVKKPKK